eukprot:TRINITY_DN68639_c0_g1_i1.p1 TRINITY_DN68639_c0_g1~~TRINITY_DN68639_c0_g1_i1.p1  ORF type:complete len:729 (+),score=116.20 TRINITY_DN68639_c0_g1_i1:108-2294(+)
MLCVQTQVFRAAAGVPSAAYSWGGSLSHRSFLRRTRYMCFSLNPFRKTGPSNVGAAPGDAPSSYRADSENEFSIHQKDFSGYKPMPGDRYHEMRDADLHGRGHSTTTDGPMFDVQMNIPELDEYFPVLDADEGPPRTMYKLMEDGTCATWREGKNADIRVGGNPALLTDPRGLPIMSTPGGFQPGYRMGGRGEVTYSPELAKQDMKCMRKDGVFAILDCPPEDVEPNVRVMSKDFVTRAEEDLKSSNPLLYMVALNWPVPDDFISLWEIYRFFSSQYMRTAALGESPGLICGHVRGVWASMYTSRPVMPMPDHVVLYTLVKKYSIPQPLLMRITDGVWVDAKRRGLVESTADLLRLADMTLAPLLQILLHQFLRWRPFGQPTTLNQPGMLSHVKTPTAASMDAQRLQDFAPPVAPVSKTLGGAGVGQKPVQTQTTEAALEGSGRVVSGQGIPLQKPSVQKPGVEGLKGSLGDAAPQAKATNPMKAHFDVSTGETRAVGDTPSAAAAALDGSTMKPFDASRCHQQEEDLISHAMPQTPEEAMSGYIFYLARAWALLSRLHMQSSIANLDDLLHARTARSNILRERLGKGPLSYDDRKFERYKATMKTYVVLPKDLITTMCVSEGELLMPQPTTSSQLRSMVAVIASEARNNLLQARFSLSLAKKTMGFEPPREIMPIFLLWDYLWAELLALNRHRFDIHHPKFFLRDHQMIVGSAFIWWRKYIRRGRFP